ncbi:unnamed protein product [Somion occarium]|uniref:Uncharacterized protein n=1 Tax=Somion occarium TaxID=3059160 RepID=A0ABP1CN35_9APHY
MSAKQNSTESLNDSTVGSKSSHASTADGSLNESNGHAQTGELVDPHIVADHNQLEQVHDISDTNRTMARKSFSSNDMRAKMALALEEQLHAHQDLTSRYQHTLTVEGSSPKPCIVPGNALQLIDDDPEGQHHHPPSIIIINDGSKRPAPESCTPDTSSAEHEPQRRPIPRVRFRSRVRIASGLHRHRQSATGNGDGHPDHTPTSSSSTSGSPSSSISAPLRWQADENATWGPLGRRLSAYAHSNGWQRRSPTTSRPQKSDQMQYTRAKVTRTGSDERTPLLSSNRPRIAYVDSGLDGGGMADDERPRVLGGRFEDEDEEEAEERALRAAALRREEEAVFGKWPWRLFNRHLTLIFYLSLFPRLRCALMYSGGGSTSSLCSVVVARTTRTMKNEAN